ncbi:MAG: hypothetical protein QM756_11995 [Polyangiaceae bacterium]
MKRLLFMLWVSCAACGCRTRSESTATAAPPVTSAPPQSSLSTEAPALPAPLPSNEDFEEDAEREISSKNLEQQLDQLERELKEP